MVIARFALHCCRPALPLSVCVPIYDNDGATLIQFQDASEDNETNGFR